MSILIVYESVFGATHEIAEEIAVGAGRFTDASAVAVEDIDPAAIPHAELIVLGAPTHSRGLSAVSSRASAAQLAADPFSGRRIQTFLTSRGLAFAAPPEGFSVMSNHRLEPGERGRAGEWGARAAQALMPVAAGPSGTTAPARGSEDDA